MKKVKIVLVVNLLFAVVVTQWIENSSAARRATRLDAELHDQLGPRHCLFYPRGFQFMSRWWVRCCASSLL